MKIQLATSGTSSDTVGIDMTNIILSPKDIFLLAIVVALVAAIVAIEWRRQTHPVVVQQQLLPDGTDGRLTLAAQLSQLALEEAKLGNHAGAGYLLLASSAISEKTSGGSVQNLPTTNPTAPTMGERVAAMQFFQAGLRPAFMQFLRAKYPGWNDVNEIVDRSGP